MNFVSSSLYNDFCNSNLNEISPLLNSLGSKLNDVKFGLNGGGIFLLITSLISTEENKGCYNIISAPPLIPNLNFGFLVNNFLIRSLASGLPTLGGNDRLSFRILLKI